LQTLDYHPYCEQDHFRNSSFSESIIHSLNGRAALRGFLDLVLWSRSLFRRWLCGKTKIRHSSIRTSEMTSTQISSPAVGSKMSERYCAPCKRSFSTKSALQMHLQNAKIHKSETRRQVRPREVTNTRLSSVSLVPPPTSPLAQSAHLGSIALTALNPDSDVEGNSMAIGGHSTD
jgi:Zinc-finger of C2H2 type